MLLREVLEVSLGEGDVGGKDESVAYGSVCHSHGLPPPSATCPEDPSARPNAGRWCEHGSTLRRQRRAPQLTLLVQGDGIAELSGLAVDLDSVVQELLERGRVEDVVVRRDRVVDVELVDGLGGGLGGGSGFGLLD